MKSFFKVVFALFILLSFDVSYASPANDLFLDDNLYKCVIDAYNLTSPEKKDYSYSILPEELIEIKTLDCSKYKGTIENLTGLNKMSGLSSLNLSGNTFLGGSLTLQIGGNGQLKSSISLPSQLSMADKVYTVENDKIVSVTNGVVNALSSGTTYVTMTAKVSGFEIQEKYLVSVSSNEPLKPKSTNSNLSSLSIEGVELDFKSSVKSYTAVVRNSVKSITISAKTADSKASFVSGYGPRKVNLKVGNNTINIKVKAENGNISTYTISITRSEGNDANNFLANIEISPGKINFSRDVTVYSLTVDGDVTKLSVNAVPESYLAKASVSDTNLKVGENKITITVTAEDGSTKKYQLIVTREDYDSSKNYLKSLTIDGYSINFKKDKFEYDLNIKNENSLKITAVPENSTSTVSITGNKDLKHDSKIVITVLDEDGVSREYEINIKKSFLSNITYKEIILIAEFITIFVLIIVIIARSNNKPQKQKINSRPNTNISQNYIPRNKICKSCGSINNPTSKTCYVCGKQL